MTFQVLFMFLMWFVNYRAALVAAPSEGFLVAIAVNCIISTVGQTVLIIKEWRRRRKWSDRWALSLVFHDREQSTQRRTHEVVWSFVSLTQQPWLLVVRNEYEVEQITFARTFDHATVLFSSTYPWAYLKRLLKKKQPIKALT